MIKYGEIITDENSRCLFFKACEVVVLSIEDLKEKQSVDLNEFAAVFFSQVDKKVPNQKDHSEIARIGQYIFEDFYEIRFTPIFDASAIKS